VKRLPLRQQSTKRRRQLAHRKNALLIVLTRDEHHCAVARCETEHECRGGLTFHHGVDADLRGEYTPLPDGWVA
jgi:hypothetical protein